MNAFKTLIVLLLLGSCQAHQSDERKAEDVSVESTISYWDTQRKGTNQFNQIPSEQWFDAAQKANIKLVRLVFEKWDAEQRDFILGNADNYQGIVESDFKKLLHFLDYANKLEIKVVITPISLPGDRWIQSNNNQNDGRIWTDSSYRQQAINYWKDLASHLKGHPALVGYNLVNEPHPESYHKKHNFWKRDLVEWYERVKGGPGDLNLFNQQMVSAIRSIDSEMPIIVESGLYATPWAFDYLEPIDDDKIIYSFHMYEPYVFVTRRLNQDRYVYPGIVNVKGLDTPFVLNKDGLRDFLEPVNEWARKHNIPSNRIWVGEFGCDRRLEGAEDYLSDLISIFNENKWHWSFYSYREDDGWDAMDYELGKKKVHYSYWDYQEAKKMHLHYDDIYHGVTDSFWEIFEREFEAGS